MTDRAPSRSRRLARWLSALRADTRGATAVEYGLILACVVLALMIGVIALGNATSESWGNLNSAVKDANDGRYR